MYESKSKQLNLIKMVHQVGFEIGAPGGIRTHKSLRKRIKSPLGQPIAQQVHHLFEKEYYQQILSY